MTSRPRLILSIPFWILLVASLALTGVGLWIVLDRLGTMEAALVNQTATGVEVYVGQPAAVVGAVVLGAGLIGLLLTAAVATLRTLIPQPDVAVVETIDWTSDDETDIEPDTAATTSPAPADPVASDATVPAASRTAEPATTATEPASSVAEPATSAAPADDEPSTAAPSSDADGTPRR